ncbi:MAG: phosphoribosylglycinamide formyltransferase [Eubacteriaceae bacterium]|nr:phosphoribosylglycinamide formyltransferase [Eubacteriaceae bacterium]
MTRIAVLISGGGSNLQSLIDTVHNSYGRIELVISNRRDAYGLVRAKNHEIKNICIPGTDPNYDRLLLNKLEEAGIDLIVLAGYLKIVSPQLIEKYRNRIINIHPSLIPAFSGDGHYGLKVHKEVIEYGAKVSGATVHFVDEGTDTGPVVMQKCVEVESDDTPESLQNKVLKIEHELLPLAVKEYCLGNIQVEGRKVNIKKRGGNE